MSFNENTRVKIPAILHLCRLGYTYLPLAQANWDDHTNIFTEIFTDSLRRINDDEVDDSDLKKTLTNVSLALDNEDLGEVFYQMLTATSGVRLIDFNDFANNAFHVVTELTYQNGDDEFRPDITLLINGLPLAFIEVKKPNNREGILAERERMNARFANSKFRTFINLFQILVFSNNMEYDADAIEPLQGAFYATSSYREATLNYFREEEQLDLAALLQPEDEAVENLVLKDNNLVAIKHSPEFLTNKNSTTPTNRLLTSLFSRERLAFLLKYGLAYVDGAHGREKHIMRYPQIFATRAITRTLDKGVKKGIIWHTQGSGKTALAFYNVHYLTDYFQRRDIVPKFYFIVDRIDLMHQAKSEFSSRGLIVQTVNSKEELLWHFRARQTLHNTAGKREITVVNIQKFQDDGALLRASDYDLNTQRIYFLDEVHRSYNPTGSFLANLFNSDRSAILIGLTGTPLIGSDRRSRDIFGDYIHTYYYNRSIADGYTLKLMREGIETHYKMLLAQALKEVEILHGGLDKRLVYAHDRFAEPMLDYIVKDFVQTRNLFQDHSIGGMVVCDSAEQAKKLFEIFINKYNPMQKTFAPVASYSMIAEQAAEYRVYQARHAAPFTAALILHDVGSKDDRKDVVDAFKHGKIDFLFVYNMLLTGFDAHRLKKLYLGRIIRDHNLLQTLTRVNRPYKQFRYGYVVDFADIRKEFDATNKAYFDELQKELGDEMEHYSDLFKSPAEIAAEIAEIKEELFHYDLTNAEEFSKQISAITDRKILLHLKKVLSNARELYNIMRLAGHFELLERLDFQQLHRMLNVTNDRLAALNLKEQLEHGADNVNLLNVALENVLFLFRKVSEAELVLADELKETLRKTREALGGNFDQRDPEFVTLYDELKRLFAKKNLDEITQEEMKANIGALRDLYARITELNRKNALLKAKYQQDAKYARTHKRLLDHGGISQKESEIWATLMDIKQQTDEKVLINLKMLDNEAFFAQMMLNMVINSFKKTHVPLKPDAARYVNACLVKEYREEYQGIPQS